VAVGAPGTGVGAAGCVTGGITTAGQSEKSAGIENDEPGTAKNPPPPNGLGNMKKKGDATTNSLHCRVMTADIEIVLAGLLAGMLQMTGF